MRARRRMTNVVMVIGLLAAATGVVLLAPTNVQAGEAECGEDGSGTAPPSAGCREDGGGGDDDTDTGGGGDDDTGGGEGGGGTFDPAALCADQAPGWGDCETVVALNGMEPNDICGYVIHPYQDQLTYYYPEADPAESILLYNICVPDGLYYTEDTQLGAVGEIVVAPPAPDEVAADLWSRVSADLEEPALDVWPPNGEAAVVNMPTFVEVTNWQGEIVEADCDDATGTVCIELTATPSLTYAPGEPSAPTVDCEDGGTAYVPGGNPTSQEQAAPADACAHAYAHATAAQEMYEAVVSVHWEVTWEGEGQAGEIDVDPLSAAIDRPVDEVSTVVEENGGGGADG